jgi:hypothetical protein
VTSFAGRQTPPPLGPGRRQTSRGRHKASGGTVRRRRTCIPNLPGRASASRVARITLPLYGSRISLGDQGNLRVAAESRARETIGYGPGAVGSRAPGKGQGHHRGQPAAGAVSARRLPRTGARPPTTRQSRSCHVHTQTSLPSESAKIQNARAWSSLTSRPPAARAASTRATASSCGTVRSR